ncbi:DUF4386 domain-containing protein [Permianibacter aggregans]|uniref:Uncharacterized protein DUF4386 n=2 Tax=Permianibacter aggregans TaxID=1510150 RepID=A0A4R6USU5_9GAMM|nr:DUF4386 domain-containing protein [Permianibacter aggregans]TDQ48743.1 uncharacterized protein DUF4386 [Permianibacter aggregans]
MKSNRFELSPQPYLRVAGILYLAIILLGLFGEGFVRSTLIVPGDAGATFLSILPSQLLWRSGAAGDLLMQVLDVPVIVLLYLLLRPVSETLALTMTLFNLVQTAVLAANKLNLLVPTFLMADSSYLNAFSTEQLQALSYLSIKSHSFGFAIGLIFFGFACLLRGYLIHRSGFMPKVIGWLLALAGLSYLVNSFALILAPTIAAMMFPLILVPAFLGELIFALWLVAKGVNLEEWQKRVAP